MQRSYEKKWMDLGLYTPQEYEEALLQLNQIGKFLGGNKATLRAFEVQDPKSIVDVGCGGGHFTKLLGQCFPEAKIQGIDISDGTIPPASGNGLSMAITGGVLAAEYALRGDAEGYRKIWQRRYSAPIFLGKIFHYAMLRPRLLSSLFKVSRVAPIPQIIYKKFSQI